LEYFRSNKNINPIRALLLIAIAGFAASCNPTKYVPVDESLLDRTFVNVSNDDFSKNEFLPYVRQKPNKRIFGARFHLGLYNWSNIEKERWPHGWLRNIGEEPVIFDPYSMGRSKEQIRSFLQSKGYFDADVIETVETSKLKSKVFYNIEVGSPYIVRSIKYEVKDTTLLKLVRFDSINCLIKPNKPYDVDVILAERLRLERFIRDVGFYGFTSDEFMYFKVDSTIGNRQVDIIYGIGNVVTTDINQKRTESTHPLYRVRNVYIYPEFSPGDALSDSESYFSSFDTVAYKGFYFIGPPGKPRIRYDLLVESLSIRPDNLFNITNTERTQKRLNSLRTYRLININYSESGSTSFSRTGEKYIDGIIQLAPFQQQSFTYELEGTNSAGNLGAALNLIYQHKNLFHGAEQFNLKLKGAYETLSEAETGFRNTQEFGAEASLQLPEFLLPFIKSENFIRKHDPKTYLQIAYNYQKIPFFTRTVANATFGYRWNSGNYISHNFYPLQLNLVKLPFIDPAFALRIDTSSYLSYAYKDVLILGGSYTYTYNNEKRIARNDVFFKFYFETAGNLLAAGSRLTGAEKRDSSYTLLGQPYAQFVRTDFDLRYKRVLNDVSSIVYRGFAGIGVPYGNSRAMPFEKQYFGGGANGLRAWKVRSLGPGSFNNDTVQFINQTADIKLELNAEYRFKLFWILEGAVFLDAGNIWTIKNDPDRPGSVFKFDKFLDDLAIGTGFGMRFDIKFVLLRGDVGIKLRDPGLQGGSKWIRANRPYNLREDFTFVFGIGYPF
jgi:outer membrane protein assembly factor BamA